MDTTNFVVEQPDLLEANISSTDITDVQCYGETTGEIIVTVNGGTTNVTDQYTYSWAPNVGVATSSFDFD